jgi:2-phospho-L-lactate guanylyltransferase
MRVALIPMKDLAGAKMRLADVLERKQRAELALAMLTDVIGACAESGCFDEIAVVTSDSDICWHARDLGAKPLAEPKTLSGLNEGLTFAQRYIGRRMAASEIVILPADVPLIRADDVRAVVDALSPAPDRVVLVRARDGGTNALAMRPVEAIAMRFGRQSADAHLAEARAAGIDAIELTSERLSFDVDAPEDLEALASMPVGAATAGWLAASAHYAADPAGDPAPERHA